MADQEHRPAPRVRAGRARRRRRRAEEFSVEPLWVVVALVAAMLLWSAGPWIGGGVLFFAAVVWVRHRLA